MSVKIQGNAYRNIAPRKNADGTFDLNRDFTQQEIASEKLINPKLEENVDAYSTYQGSYRDWAKKLTVYSNKSDYNQYYEIMPPKNDKQLCNQLAIQIQENCKKNIDCEAKDSYDTLHQKHDAFMNCRNLRAIQQNSKCKYKYGWVDPYESRNSEDGNHTKAIKVDAEKALQCVGFGDRALIKERKKSIKLRHFMEQFKERFIEAFKGSKYNKKLLFKSYFLDEDMKVSMPVPAVNLKKYFARRVKGDTYFSYDSIAFTKKHKTNIESLLDEIKRQDQLKSIPKMDDDNYYVVAFLKYNDENEAEELPEVGPESDDEKDEPIEEDSKGDIIEILKTNLAKAEQEEEKEAEKAKHDAEKATQGAILARESKALTEFYEKRFGRASKQVKEEIIAFLGLINREIDLFDFVILMDGKNTHVARFTHYFEQRLNRIFQIMEDDKIGLLQALVQEERELAEANAKAAKEKEERKKKVASSAFSAAFKKAASSAKGVLMKRTSRRKVSIKIKSRHKINSRIRRRMSKNNK